MKRSGIKHTRRLRSFSWSTTEIYDPLTQTFRLRKGARRLRRRSRARNWYLRTVYVNCLNWRWATT